MKNSIMAVMLVALALLSACALQAERDARQIDDIDVSGRDGACVRSCLEPYSACSAQASRAYATAHVVDALTACKSAYRTCVNTCPRTK